MIFLRQFTYTSFDYILIPDCTPTVQLTTHDILLCFLQTVFPNFFLFSLSTSKISQLSSLTTKPSGFKSSYNCLCLCAPYLSPSQRKVLRSLPPAEYRAHLISIFSLHYCYKINHSPHQCATPSEEELGYGHNSALTL